jgi:hypothetical protein
MSFQRFVPAATLGALAACLSMAAHAETFTFGSLLSGTGPSSLNFATLAVTANGNDLDFTLTAPGLDAFGPDAFLGAIAVDGIKKGSVTGVTGGAPVAIANGGGPGGSYDFRFDLTGPKQARLTDGESVHFTWSGAAQSLSTLTFAAHVQGVTSAGSSSSLWYTTSAVPEASVEAMALGGIAVCGMLGLRRRHQRAG